MPIKSIPLVRSDRLLARVMESMEEQQPHVMAPFRDGYNVCHLVKMPMDYTLDFASLVNAFLMGKAEDEKLPDSREAIMRSAAGMLLRYAEMADRQATRVEGEMIDMMKSEAVAARRAATIIFNGG